MNVQKIKKDFLKLALECINAASLPTADGGIVVGLLAPARSILIRGTFSLHGDVVETYKACLNTAVAEMMVVSKEREWSEASVDDLIANHLTAVLFAAPDQKDKVAKQKADKLIKALQAPTPFWTVDLPVFGFAENCDGLSFGLLTLVAGQIEALEELGKVPPRREQRLSMFARLTIKAVDTQSAVERAIAILKEHLTVLNAVCSEGYPSHIRVGADPEEFLKRRPYRVTRPETNGEAVRGIKQNVTSMHLSRAMFEARMEQRGGARVSEWLKQPNSLARRMLSAYLLAGTACTDDLHQRSFLLFAVALESAVLGSAMKTEVTFRLSTHIANLLGGTLDERRSTRTDVGKLYTTRSDVAHWGKSDISSQQLQEMLELCLSALLCLTILPPFTKMTESKELDDWFTDRLISSPSNHITSDAFQ